MTHGKATEMARNMLLGSVGKSIRYEAMAMETGLLESSLRCLVTTMRKKGLLPPYEPESYEYVGTSQELGVVRFKSLGEAQAGGFTSSMVSKAVNGIIDSYAGYKWEKVAK